ncbi:DUF4199 domain-containing protein [Bizionia sediminis]|uniref:DUF4199 domain-containing protein n=1 Tax=Bizionia sediminis TaxID=1737064 RepID=A0ABW5KVY4_9FLAO
MMQTAIKYGLISSAVLSLFFGASYLLEYYFKFYSSQFIGFSGILLALSCVYFGIKKAKTKAHQGLLSLTKAIKLGLLISIFPAITFGCIHAVYTNLINPEFSETYYQEAIKNQQNTLPATDFKKKRQALQAQQQAFTNPAFKFFLLSSLVFSMGFLVSITAGLFLKQKK